MIYLTNGWIDLSQEIREELQIASATARPPTRVLAPRNNHHALSGKVVSLAPAGPAIDPRVVTRALLPSAENQHDARVRSKPNPHLRLISAAHLRQVVRKIFFW